MKRRLLEDLRFVTKVVLAKVTMLVAAGIVSHFDIESLTEQFPVINQTADRTN